METWGGMSNSDHPVADIIIMVMKDLLLTGATNLHPYDIMQS